MQGATAFGQLDTAKQLTCRLQMAAPVGFFGFSVSFASSHSCTVSIFAKKSESQRTDSIFKNACSMICL